MLPDLLPARVARVVEVTVVRRARVVVPNDLPADVLERVVRAASLGQGEMVVVPSEAPPRPDDLWLADDYRRLVAEPARWGTP